MLVPFYKHFEHKYVLYSYAQAHADSPQATNGSNNQHWDLGLLGTGDDLKGVREQAALTSVSLP